MAYKGKISHIWMPKVSHLTGSRNIKKLLYKMSSRILFQKFWHIQFSPGVHIISKHIFQGEYAVWGEYDVWGQLTSNHGCKFRFAHSSEKHADLS